MALAHFYYVEIHEQKWKPQHCYAGHKHFSCWMVRYFLASFPVTENLNKNLVVYAVIKYISSPATERRDLLPKTKRNHGFYFQCDVNRRPKLSCSILGDTKPNKKTLMVTSPVFYTMLWRNVTKNSLYIEQKIITRVLNTIIGKVTLFMLHLSSCSLKCKYSLLTYKYTSLFSLFRHNISNLLNLISPSTVYVQGWMTWGCCYTEILT